MAETKKNSGVTANTPNRIVFDTGTIHKGLKYENGAWNYNESLVGATSGGTKFNVTPELYKIVLDGSYVATKGNTKKVGEVATLEINFAELTNDILLASTLGKADTSDDTEMDKFISKFDIVEGDYWENVAVVGRTAEGKNCIVILPNALCTSGLTIDGKPKAEGVSTIVFECHADPSNAEVLPYEIYFPKVA
jgi:hypothetical protein